MELFSVLNIIVLLQGAVSYNPDNGTVYASIGDRANLHCRVIPDALSYRWRRNDIVLSNGLDVNREMKGYQRFQSSRDSKEFYSLFIFNITYEDVGIYWCGRQIKQGIDEVKVELKIIGHTPTVLETIEKVSTTVYRDDETTGDLYTEIFTTDNNRSNNDDTNIGLSTREIFYYSLLAAGLLLVLCLSIGCNICINRKCKSVILRRDTKEEENENIAGITTEERNTQGANGIDIIEESDTYIFSQYETIDESKMIQYPITNSSLNIDINKSIIAETKANEADKELLQMDSPYLDVIPDDGDMLQAQVQDLENLHKILAYPDSEISTKPDSKLKSPEIRITNSQKVKIIQPCTKRNSHSTNSSASRISTDDEVGWKRDEYLNPYVLLNMNDMEYLNTYSTPIIVDFCNRNTAVNQLKCVSLPCLIMDNTGGHNTKNIKTCKSKSFSEISVVNITNTNSQ